jgi:hypothetical protein
MRCPEKARLLAAYEAAVGRLTIATADLRIMRGVTSKEEYDRLLQTTETARYRARAAMSELMAHIQQHRC